MAETTTQILKDAKVCKLCGKHYDWKTGMPEWMKDYCKECWGSVPKGKPKEGPSPKSRGKKKRKK